MALDVRARFLDVRDGPAVALVRHGAMKDWLVLAAVLEAGDRGDVADCPVACRAVAVRHRADRHGHDDRARDGIALIALGIACWPGTPRVGMVTYGAAVTLYLAYLGFAGDSTGVLLWPAVILHAILTALLTRTLATVESFPD